MLAFRQIDGFLWEQDGNALFDSIGFFGFVANEASIFQNQGSVGDGAA